MSAPIESKVYAALIGGTVGTVSTNLVLWLVGAFLFGGPRDAVSNAAAIAEVPDSIAAAIRLTITLGCIGLAGYYAKHTPRALEDGQGVALESPVTIKRLDLRKTLPPVPNAEHLLSPTDQRKLEEEDSVSPESTTGSTVLIVEDDGLPDETEKV